MKKILAIQIVAIVLVSGALGGMFVATDIYEQTYNRIVSVICLSCIKLDPATSLDFRFETANGEEHPDFILENLTKGPVFLAYRTDVCEYCDYMEPLIIDMLGVHFEMEDNIYETIEFQGKTITFMHINNDHATDTLRLSQGVYDIDGAGGVPQFTTITFGYDRGFVKPYYNTVYGILNAEITDDERIDILSQLILDAAALWEQNHAGHDHG